MDSRLPSAGPWILPGCLVALALAVPAARSLPAEPERPNFILIFCDDLGYADLGAFGSKKHRTPNIDRLAEEGRKFTSFYVTSGVCTPSRASLMTGCYPRRVGLHESEKGAWVLFPRNARGLHPDEVTLAEALREEGYATACIGKWHLGDQPEFLPTRQGFESYFGIPYSNDMGKIHGNGRVDPNRSYPPLPLLRNEEVIEVEPDQSQLTRRYTEEAVRFIEENRDRSFFLYLPHTMPHAPQYASERFRGKSANGRWGDAVEEIDWSTGEILAVLERLEIDDRTLVVFLSDNGGATRWGSDNTPLRGGKGSTWEGGHRVPCLMRWPGRIPAGTVSGEIATSMDLLPTFARLAGGEPPKDRIIDGKDITPLVRGEEGAKTPHEAYFYYFKGDLQAVRSGRWKLFLARREGRRRNRDEARELPRRLYDLEEDIGESRNVAAEHPEVVERLEKLADECREDLGDGKRKGKNCRAPGRVDEPRALEPSRARETR